MVNADFLKQPLEVPQVIDDTDLPEEELRWCTVSLREVCERDNRLEASVFDLEGKHAREVLKQCKWPLLSIAGKNGIADNVFVPGRVKRVYIKKDSPNAIGFLGSSEMLDVRPIACKWLSKIEPKHEQFKIKKGWVLISCSGTIGNIAYVSETLSKYMVSQHAIRISSDYPGYVYSFLKTDIAKTLVNTNIYGAVISEIEPHHFQEVSIPNPPDILKKQIHDLIVHSYNLRDESNVLFEKAEALLFEALQLPPILQLEPNYFKPKIELRSFEVKLSTLAGRFEASYHVPIVDTITKQIKRNAVEITHINDPQISRAIILPGHFKRIYVDEGQGTVLIGGKVIFELDPANKKFLALPQYTEKLKNQIKIKENMLIITAKGTVGKVILVPKHWDNWTISSNLISIVPSSSDIAGYLYVFLNSSYGQELIKRNIYGAVVNIIEPCHIEQIIVPLLKDKDIQKEINRLAIEANKKRSAAYYKEQEAIRIMNEKVIHAGR